MQGPCTHFRPKVSALRHWALRTARCAGQAIAPKRRRVNEMKVHCETSEFFNSYESFICVIFITSKTNAIGVYLLYIGYMPIVQNYYNAILTICINLFCYRRWQIHKN